MVWNIGHVRGQTAAAGLGVLAAACLAVACVAAAAEPAAARSLQVPLAPSAAAAPALEPPTITALSPNPVTGAGVLSVDITDPNGGAVASVGIAYYAQNGNTILATLPTAGVTAAGRRGDDTYWTVTATAPSLPDSLVGHVAITDTLATGQVTPQSAQVPLALTGPPLRQLPQTPYAGLFPLALLLAFGLFWRRRRAA